MSRGDSVQSQFGGHRPLPANLQPAHTNGDRGGNRGWTLLIVLITLLAFGLRLYRLDTVPPGWRDDELINSLVISQKVLDGELSVYYDDASGHEALYHVLNAGMLALFGPGTAGIRFLSVILGTLTVPLTYLVGSRLFGRKVGLLAAAALAVSFWSLMYSRIGIRHISLPVFMLAAFYFFLRGMGIGFNVHALGEEAKFMPAGRSGANLPDFLLAGLFMGIGFYTYFASRGVPVILLTFCLYLLLFGRRVLWRHRQGVLVMFGLAALTALPLIIILARQPESEARVEELAVPLVEARRGNFQPLAEHVIRTLSMFHSYGDEEWLYNVPGRPLFGPLGALFFWAGVMIASWYAVKPLIRFTGRLKDQRAFGAEVPLLLPGEAAAAFALLWWLAGIAPGFISVPPASLGHTIIALPVVYILGALPLLPLINWQRQRFGQPAGRIRLASVAVALLLLISIVRRDLPDYFQAWPARGMTGFLYRAEIKRLSGYLNEHPEMTEFGVGGLLAGPWDRLALEIDLENDETVTPRWFNADRVTFLRINGLPALNFIGYPQSPTYNPDLYQPVLGSDTGRYHLTRIYGETATDGHEVCFTNGLCLVAANYDPDSQDLDLTWEAGHPLDLPVIPLISNPPPPGVYSGPRLLVFAQLLDGDGQLLAGDDGLWVDVTTIREGDRFIQQHRLSSVEHDTAARVIFGLYDPMSSERIKTVDGRDHLALELGQ